MISVRKIMLEDVADVFEIETESFSRPWTKNAIEDVVTDDKAYYLVAFDEQEKHVVGYVGAYIICGEADINQVAVRKDYRRRGIGTVLLDEFFGGLSKQGITSATLEVRAGNIAAIRLYESRGFVCEGIRKNFYDAPKEDALIMWKHEL